jgi:hypothetical protein
MIPLSDGIPGRRFQHVQVVRRNQSALLCEQCGAKLERRTHSSV